MFEVAGGGRRDFFCTRSAISLMAIQSKPPRVLQEREFRAVGDTRIQAANFRLITATNKDLKTMVAACTFPRGPVLPHQYFSDRRPGAARAPRRHSAARGYHFLHVFADELRRTHLYFRRRDERVGQLQLAGQRRELENVIQRAAILTTTTSSVGPTSSASSTFDATGGLGGAENRRRAQTDQEGRAGEVGGGDREAVRARGAQAQRLERHQERRGHRGAAPIFRR